MSDHMQDMQDTEVTLSTGKLLGIFFAAAIICGIFFSFGYAVGKNSTPAAGVAIMDSSSLSTVSASGGTKPAATKPAGPAKPCLSSEDADALKAALEKKQYPVFVVDNSQSHLFHVQVGPFSDQKDAEAMKNKLSADGYNAILKR